MGHLIPSIRKLRRKKIYNIETWGNVKNVFHVIYEFS
jgi:hypothetical protein